MGCPRRDQDIARDLYDAVLRDAVLHDNVRVAIDTDVDEAAIADDINTEAPIIQQGREIHMERPPAAGVRGRLLAVVRVRVQRLVGDDMVLHQRLEVLAAVLAEQKGVDARPELAEGEVAGREERAARVVRLGDVVGQAGLRERELERGELAGEERDDGEGRGGREEDVVDAVDDAVGAELVAVLAVGGGPGWKYVQCWRP